MSSEAAVLPGGEEQGDCGSTSENQRAGREPACQRPRRQPSEEEKDLVCLDANKLLTRQLCRCMNLLTSQGAEATEVFNSSELLTYFTHHLFNYTAYCALSYLTRCAVSQPCSQVTSVERAHLNTGIPV